jgi:hypothetical protein
VRWRLWLWIAAIGLASCHTTTPGTDAGVELGTPADGFVYVRCPGICVRPSDCVLAYPDDDFCPPGFVCKSTFPCNDAGM